MRACAKVNRNTAVKVGNFKKQARPSGPLRYSRFEHNKRSRGSETRGAEAPEKHRRRPSGPPGPPAPGPSRRHPHKRRLAGAGAFQERRYATALRRPAGPAPQDRRTAGQGPASPRAASHLPPGGPILTPRARSDRALFPQNRLGSAQTPGRGSPSPAPPAHPPARRHGPPRAANALQRPRPHTAQQGLNRLRQDTARQHTERV